MKIWDIGGQFQYRQNWVDYAKMGDVIIFMIDGSNVRKKINKYNYIELQYDTVPVAKKELHSLLDEKGIEGKPLLILNNKIDIEPHMTDVDIIKELNLDYVYSNKWAVISISALKELNLEDAIYWLSNKTGK